jgi:hypothetical protein
MVVNLGPCYIADEIFPALPKKKTSVGAVTARLVRSCCGKFFPHTYRNHLFYDGQT